MECITGAKVVDRQSVVFARRTVPKKKNKQDNIICNFERKSSHVGLGSSGVVDMSFLAHLVRKKRQGGVVKGHAIEVAANRARFLSRDVYRKNCHYAYLNVKFVGFRSPHITYQTFQGQAPLLVCICYGPATMSFNSPWSLWNSLMYL